MRDGRARAGRGPTSSACAWAAPRWADYVRGEVSPGEERALERHLEDCRGCRRRVRFEARLAGRLRALGTAIGPRAPSAGWETS
ncbi:MAG: zf-HC2 domain-containing protein [Gemmatimonadota bacterium]